MSEEHWHAARLIPISGIRGEAEQERRGTSALLAVLSAVKEFQRELLKPLGAPAGRVSAYCEVPFELEGKKPHRVDGLIQVVRGKRTWTLLVEVKTGKSELGPDQIENYLDIVRRKKFDGLLTISNQLVSVHGQHPVSINKVRYGKVPLYHLSWARILATARRVHDHIGVDDPEQKWILQELIKYLDHDNSGARRFDDMGPLWTKLRTALRDETLTKGDEEATSVAVRWEQLLQHISLSLAARLNRDVHPVVSRKEAKDPAIRTAALAQELAETGKLSGTIAIPNAVAPLTISADLRAMTAFAAVTLDAPGLAKPTARLNWLLRQLRSVSPDALRIDASFERTKHTDSERLDVILNDPKTLLGGTDKAPRSFTVATKPRSIGAKRRAGTGSFVSDVEHVVEEFYREVVQGLKVWTQPAAKLAEDEPEDTKESAAPEPQAEPEEAGAGS